MTTRIEITFRGIAPDESVRELARQQIENLPIRCARCRILVERTDDGSPVHAQVALAVARGIDVYVDALHPVTILALRRAFWQLSRVGRQDVRPRREARDKAQHAGKAQAAPALSARPRMARLAHWP